MTKLPKLKLKSEVLISLKDTLDPTLTYWTASLDMIIATSIFAAKKKWQISGCKV